MAGTLAAITAIFLLMWAKRRFGRGLEKVALGQELPRPGGEIEPLAHHVENAGICLLALGLPAFLIGAVYVVAAF